MRNQRQFEFQMSRQRYRDLPKSAGIDETKRERLSPATVVLVEEFNPPEEFAPVRWMVWLNYDVKAPMNCKVLSMITK